MDLDFGDFCCLSGVRRAERRGAVLKGQGCKMGNGGREGEWSRNDKKKRVKRVKQ